MALIQTWPQDWDGVVAWYPAISLANKFRAHLKWTQALAAPDGYLSPEKRMLLRDSVLAACDGLDGVKDGIVSNVDACRTAFNPKTALTAGGRPLRCTGGLDLGSSCLSDAQINSVVTMASPTPFAQATIRGDTDAPGMEWGSDLGGGVYSNSLGGLIAAVGSYVLGLGTLPPSYLTNLNPVLRAAMPADSWFGADYARFMVAGNPFYDFLGLNTYSLGSYTARVHELEGILNKDDPNLSPFFQRGGKVILVQGMADSVVPLEGTRRYYNRVLQTVPAALTNGGLRYYEVPGMAHAVGLSFTGQWDGLAALQQWVENGTAPVNPIVQDGGAPRSRPLCQYPTWPEYLGGDPNVASSFSCAKG